MSQADNSVDNASFRDSIPDSHQPTCRLLRQLIEELVHDDDVSIKWGTIAYDLDGSLFALSANKKHVNLYTSYRATARARMPLTISFRSRDGRSRKRPCMTLQVISTRASAGTQRGSFPIPP